MTVQTDMPSIRPTANKTIRATTSAITVQREAHFSPAAIVNARPKKASKKSIAKSNVSGSSKGEVNREEGGMYIV